MRRSDPQGSPTPSFTPAPAPACYATRFALRRTNHRRIAPEEAHRRAPCAAAGRPVGPRRVVALADRVARHLTRHRRRRPVESSGNCPKTQPLVAASMNLVTFVHRQLAVVFSHAHTLPNSGCCTSFWSPPRFRQAPPRAADAMIWAPPCHGQNVPPDPACPRPGQGLVQTRGAAAPLRPAG